MNYSDVIAKTRRRLLSGVREAAVLLTEPYTAGSPTLNVEGSFLNAIQPGCILSVDLEVFYVTSVTTAGSVGVVPGYDGSTEADHATGTICYVNPRFTNYDIGVAINDDLLDLSAPYNGLGQVLTTSFTWNPTYLGYDLGSQFSPISSSVLEVSYKLAPPVRTYPTIRDYRVDRNADTTVFPSGVAIILYQPAYTGLPVTVKFLAPFSPLVNLTDDLTEVAGLPASMYDLPDLGAAIRLVQPREVKRNFLESQPDPRKAPEVPPSAVMNSSAKLEMQRQKRIDAEADRLSRAYPHREAA